MGHTENIYGKSTETFSILSTSYKIPALEFVQKIFRTEKF